MPDTDETRSYAGFRSHDAALTVLFITLLRPAIHSRIKTRWKSLRHVHADMASHCEDQLLEMRAAGTLPDEPLDDLAERLVRASAVVYQRADERHARLSGAAMDEPAERPDDAEGSVIRQDVRQRVWKLQAKLPTRHQQVLEAYAEAETGDRTLAEILGVSAEAARQMAHRARAALYAAIREAGLTAADFLEVSDG